MLIWGGRDSLNVYQDGGRYDPQSDSWSSILSVGAPTGRYEHRAVWTGKEMIIWGGVDSLGAVLGDGSRYNPSKDSWTAMTTVNVPSPRRRFTAIWTTTISEGDKMMIIWGGDDGTNLMDSGARYTMVEAQEVTLGTGGTAHLCSITKIVNESFPFWPAIGVLFLFLLLRFLFRLKILKNLA
jgi:hypothetical protein